ncbi:O-antigen polymerase [Acinetobacter sp.]|uniref:O-antigen polymerase n=1 Tax=Acinetobacter sp. TaxID=472 RepID=UPI003D08E698
MFSVYLIVLCVIIVLIYKLIFRGSIFFTSSIFFVVFSQIYFFLAPPRFFIEQSLNVLIYHTITLTLIFITLVLLEKKFFQVNNKEFIKKYNFNENVFLCLSFFLISIPILIFYINGMDVFSIFTRFYKTDIFEAADLGSYSTIINLITRSVYLIIIISRFIYNYTDNIFYKKSWYIFLLFCLLTVLSTGVRSGLVFLVLSIIVVDIFCAKGTFNKKIIEKSFVYALLAIIILPAIFFLSQFRSTKFENYTDLKEQLTFKNLSNKNIEDKDFYNLNDNIAFSAQKYHDNICTLCSVEFILVNPVPRFIWPNKPVGFGKVLANDMTGAPLKGPGLSMAGGLPGEAIYNLGYLGLFVFPILFGVILSIASWLLIYSRSIFYSSCGLFFLVSYIGTYRGDWSSIPAFFINCIFVLFLILISNKISSLKILGKK